MAEGGGERVAGTILAGGQSRRMGGGDKCMMSLGGQPMLYRVIRRFRHQVNHLALSANGDPKRFDLYDLPVLADTLPDHPGPLAGVLAGMRHAAGLGGVNWIATVPADCPFIPEDLVARLRAAGPGRRAIAIAASGGRVHPTAGLWPVVLADDLQHWLKEANDNRALAYVRRHDPVIVSFGVGANGIDPFFNVNTEDDLHWAEAALDESERR